MSGEVAKGQQLLGKLRVLRKLGEGASGAVWEVEHLLTQHHRALKVLHPHLSANRAVVERFLREASAAGRVGSPHLVEVFDAGTLENGAPYLLMEALLGEPLGEVLRRRGVLSASASCEVLVQCCTAMQAAHQAGIVHRDLKPDNLFVITVEGAPFIKVLDFGVSKFDGGAVSATRSGAVVGTPLYMAPEQMRGSREVDARADVYALGAVAYQCLAGVTPYPGASFAEVAALALAGGARPLQQLRPELPTGLAAAVMRALALSPEDRFPSARALGEALGPFIAAEPSADTWWREDEAAPAANGPGPEGALSSDERLEATLPSGGAARAAPPSPSPVPRLEETLQSPAGRSSGAGRVSSSDPLASGGAAPNAPALADTTPPPQGARVGLPLIVALAVGAAGAAWFSRAPPPVAPPELPPTLTRAVAEPSGEPVVVSDAGAQREPDAGAAAVDAGVRAPDAGRARPKPTAAERDGLAQEPG